MNSDTYEKIEFEGSNFLTFHGIESMCINKNEVDSVFNELPKGLFFINGRIKVTLFEQILLAHNIHTKYFQKSLLSFSLIEPRYVPAFRKFKHILKWFSREAIKTVNLYGFFELKKRNLKINNEKIECYSLHATNSSYMEYKSKDGQLKKTQLTHNFYCLVSQNHINIDTSFEAPYPSSAFVYDYGTNLSCHYFYLERDVIALLEKEGYQYNLIEPNCKIVNGEVILNPRNTNNPIDNKNKQLNSKTENSLLNLIGALVLLLRGDRPRRFTSTKQLGGEISDTYPGILGLSETGVERKISQALHQLQTRVDSKIPNNEEITTSIQKLIKQASNKKK